MANYTNHKNNKPLTKEVLDEIQRRFKNGEAKTHIALSLGISHSVVRKYTMPLPHYIDESVKEEALRLLEAGHSRRSIAKMLRVCRKWVSELAPEKGSKPQRYSEQVKTDLMRMVLAGESCASAARTLGINKSAAFCIVNARGRIPDATTNAEIKLCIENGGNLKDTAKKYNVPISMVKLISGKNTTRLTYSEAERTEMAKQYSTGNQLKKIAIEFGTTVTAVKKEYIKALSLGIVEPRIEIAMEDDRELKRVARIYPQYEEWRRYALEWYSVVEGNFAVTCSVINRFFLYLAENSLFERPVDFLLKSNRKSIPDFFDVACPRSDHGAASNNALVDFVDWILLQPEFADTSEEEPTTLPMFRNPFSKRTRSDHKVQRGSESNKKVMPYWMIYDLRERLAQGPNFCDWDWAQSISGKMTTSGDKESREWFEVTEDQIDLQDPDCVTRIRNRVYGPPLLEMWSPIRWVVCLLKLQTTGRTGQIRMLDSGEADTFLYQNGTFVLNQNNLKQGTQKKPRRQSAIRESSEGTAVLYFNTNKTGDIGKDGADKGMECPWPKFPKYQDSPYYWIEKLRNWQMKYNPIESLSSWEEIPSARRLRGKSVTNCATYLDTAFLCRTAETENARQYPISNGMIDKTWQLLIAAYETVLDKEDRRNPDCTPIQLVKNGRAEFPPHAIRVSLITHLILDGDMPVELMMKIVGHVRFVMTIYYTKPGLQRIEDALENAAKILDRTKDATLIRDLTTLSSEQIRKEVIFNAKELVDVIPLNPADRNAAGWQLMHDGICLAGGNTGPINGDIRFPGCHNGGSLTDAAHQTYGAAPGGVRNCCRCRWKCAGKQHILGLQASLNNRQYHLYKASEKAIEAERLRNKLLQEKAGTESENQPFQLMKELRAAERAYEIAMQRMESLALDLVALSRTIERIKELPESTEERSVFAAQGDSMTLHSILEETDSELLILAGICEDVEFFPDLDPGVAVFEYAALLDQAFEREGKPLILARLSEKEKLITANAIMRELERCTNSENSMLARRKVVEIMDRGESLEKVLGIKLNRILQTANQGVLCIEPLKFISGGRSEKP